MTFIAFHGIEHDMISFVQCIMHIALTGQMTSIAYTYQ